MAAVLENVLASSRGVRFLGLNGLGTSPLIDKDPGDPEPDQDAAPPETGQGLQAAFKHGLKLEVSGSYLDTLKVLRKLESLPWTFFWESVDLQVQEYPEAKTEITVFTLSWQRAWIGV